VVADGHSLAALAALAADDQALEERGTLARRPGPAVLTSGRCVGCEDCLVDLEGLEADVALVGAGDEDGPLVA
jgi:hypothetical protein